ncbi:MAG: hypothetical protein ABI120_00460 [Gemmatimonadaceae bacterium]
MDDIRPRLEQALSGVYTVERELGAGGMSHTYLARKIALQRRVVIKVLAPELLSGISVERFRREVLLAAQLQHPHVVPVLTAGDVDGIPWFTMPYVDGDSLRQRLGTGSVGIGEAISILRDVARLGELYEAQGNRAKAIENYSKFVDLWANADARFQPRVQDIRARITTLRGDPG